MLLDEYRVDKEKGLAELSKRKLSKVVLDFEGGNDEGGVTGRTFYGTDGHEVKLDVERAYEYRYNPETKRHEKAELTAEEKADNAFLDVIEAPVYAKYGTFAGEFSVCGTVTWDVAEGAVRMNAAETVDHYASADEEW